MGLDGSLLECLLATSLFFLLRCNSTSALALVKNFLDRPVSARGAYSGMLQSASYCWDQ